jgi:hypothetical protein
LEASSIEYFVPNKKLAPQRLDEFGVFLANVLRDVAIKGSDGFGDFMRAVIFDGIVRSQAKEYVGRLDDVNIIG